MNWDERLLLWNEAAIKLLDIRRVARSPGDDLRGYALPSSALLWIRRGSARVTLAGTDYAVEGLLGKALGREEQAHAVVRAYEDKLRQAKEAIVQASRLRAFRRIYPSFRQGRAIIFPGVCLHKHSL